MITLPLRVLIKFFLLFLFSETVIAFTPRPTSYSNTACGPTTRGPTTPIRLRQNQILQNNNQFCYTYTYPADRKMSATTSSESAKTASKSWIARIGSSTSMVVAGTFFLALAYQRDDFMITFFIGSILNGISSKILKRILNVDRPEGFQTEDSVKVKPSDKGMPSSHAMSLGFIGTYCIIQAFQSMGLTLASYVIAASLVAYSALSLIYRVQSKLHTLDQILVGLFFGISNSCMWHSLAFGRNFLFPSLNLMEIVSLRLLDESGILPVQYLAIPALVGAAVVGSVERRISSFSMNWLASRKSKSQ